MSLEDLIDFLQDRAEEFELAGREDVFQVLDAAAERLREIERAAEGKRRR